MKNLSELFANCAWKIAYETVGNDVNYAFVEDGDTLYIYFQGSKDIKADKGWIDWLRNFWFFPKYIRPYEDMKIPFKVHSGFLAAWDEVKNVIKEKIMEVDCNSVYIKDQEADFNKENFNVTDLYRWKEIIIVGYSHGGALSGLCHEFCQYWRRDLHQKDKIIGIGFESPRFLHCWKVPKKLKDRWKNYTVIRNCKDIVTHCPPHIFKFCHVGTMYHISFKSKGLIQDHMPQNVYDNLKICEQIEK